MTWPFIDWPDVPANLLVTISSVGTRTGFRTRSDQPATWGAGSAQAITDTQDPCRTAEYSRRGEI
jgi:hypothetical protein